jgi:flagellar biosynthesis protein FlhB
MRNFFYLAILLVLILVWWLTSSYIELSLAQAYNNPQAVQQFNDADAGNASSVLFNLHLFQVGRVVVQVTFGIFVALLLTSWILSVAKIELKSAWDAVTKELD